MKGKRQKSKENRQKMKGNRQNMKGKIQNYRMLYFNTNDYPCEPGLFAKTMVFLSLTPSLHPAGICARHLKSNQTKMLNLPISQ